MERNQEYNKIGMVSRNASYLNYGLDNRLLANIDRQYAEGSTAK